MIQMYIIFYIKQLFFECIQRYIYNKNDQYSDNSSRGLVRRDSIASPFVSDNFF